MRPERKRLRCALYTRKSSDEGLEQSFNSLDAQREACAAYVQSQRHEGWRALETRYDDGGYSGGSMERPALRALLSDIGAGKVDVVVVYKVDRLTRSLPDFAKIVERFDAREHPGIITRTLWERVQARLRENTVAQRTGARAVQPSLLAGILFDERGNRLTPSHGTKGGQRYRYYFSQATLRSATGPGGVRRVPVAELESLVMRRLSTLLASGKAVLDAGARRRTAPRSGRA